MKNEQIRKQFPQINDKIIYFDNAATSLKPNSVIETIDNFYRRENANIYRGLYHLSQKATENYENARKIIQNFANAGEDYAVVFTRGATDGINLLTQGLVLDQSHDEIVVSRLEHHSNLLPWQRFKQVKILECNSMGQFSKEEIIKTITERTRLVAISAWSNVLGKNYDLAEILATAKKYHAITVVDGAQWVANEKISMKNIDALVFSGHKMYGPMGIGALIAKKSLLENLQVRDWGGEMIEFVHDIREYGLAEIPQRFEAGSMNVADAIAMAKATEWIMQNGYFEKEKSQLYKQLRTGLEQIRGLKILAGKDITSFTIENIHPHDIAQFLADHGICVRAGYHCAQPLLEKLGTGPVVRVSLACYNTTKEVQYFCQVLGEIHKAMRLD